MTKEDIIVKELEIIINWFDEATDGECFLPLRKAYDLIKQLEIENGKK